VTPVVTVEQTSPVNRPNYLPDIRRKLSDKNFLSTEGLLASKQRRMRKQHMHACVGDIIIV